MNTLHVIAVTSGKLTSYAPALSKLPRLLRISTVLLLAVFAGLIVAAQFDSAVAGLLGANAMIGALTFSPVLGMKTLQLVSYSATQPNTGAAAAAVTGDALVVPYGSGKPAHIVAWWADNQTAGSHQLTFPSGHDTTRGIRMRVRASEVLPLIPRGVPIEVQAGETLSVTIVGSNTAGDVESGSFLMAYDDLPGITGRGITWAQFQSRYQKMVTVDLTVTGAAAGYTGSVALNNASDLLLPNRDYALLGAVSDTESCAVAIIGPDTGNIRVGCPASDAEQDQTNEFFAALAREFDAPLIPVINSGNKANTLVSILQDENNITPKISLIFGLLK